MEIIAVVNVAPIHLYHTNNLHGNGPIDKSRTYLFCGIDVFLSIRKPQFLNQVCVLGTP